MAPSLQPLLFPSSDPRFTFHASRFTVRPISLLLALLCFICAACGTTSQTGKILFDDPRGTVSLQTMSDQSIHANHPISLEPALLVQVLKGIEIQTHEVGIQGMLSGSSAHVPVFSDEQILFLAPLLAEALRKAAPDEQVEYRIQTTYEGSMLETSTTETTAGSLYAYGRQLNVILSQYRSSPTRTNFASGDINYRIKGLDHSGLRNRTLLFTPRTAQRPDAINPQAEGKSTDRFLAVDYQLLQQAPPAAATAGQTTPQMGATPMSGSPVLTSPSEAQTHSTNTEALAQEVEALRKELQSVQQQLGNQPTKPDSPKKKTTPAKK